MEKLHQNLHRQKGIVLHYYQNLHRQKAIVLHHNNVGHSLNDSTSSLHREHDGDFTKCTVYKQLLHLKHQ